MMHEYSGLGLDEMRHLDRGAMPCSPTVCIIKTDILLIQSRRELLP
jgi:hypothetical protein